MGESKRGLSAAEVHELIEARFKKDNIGITLEEIHRAIDARARPMPEDELRNLVEEEVEAAVEEITAIMAPLMRSFVLGNEPNQARDFPALADRIERLAQSAEDQSRTYAALFCEKLALMIHQDQATKPGG